MHPQYPVSFCFGTCLAASAPGALGISFFTLGQRGHGGPLIDTTHKTEFAPAACLPQLQDTDMIGSWMSDVRVMDMHGRARKIKA